MYTANKAGSGIDDQGNAFVRAVFMDDSDPPNTTIYKTFPTSSITATWADDVVNKYCDYLNGLDLSLIIPGAPIPSAKTVAQPPTQSALNNNAYQTAAQQLLLAIQVDDALVVSASSKNSNIVALGNALRALMPVVTVTGVPASVSAAAQKAAIPTINSVVPVFGSQGSTITVEITGQGTSFQQGVTTIAFIPPGGGMFGGSGITVNSVTINSSTDMVISVTIDQSALTQNSTITIQTNQEVVQVLAIGNSGGFTVVPATTSQQILSLLR